MANLSSKTGTVTTPVQAQISLANNSATAVQDMSAYDSQEVTGFVYVDATADLRCSFSVQVVKNGAGTYEIAASDQSGDNYLGAPLLSFSMSGSVLRVTLPNVTGFVSAYLRYQLSAPYLGGNYPLSVDGSQVVSGTVAAARLPAATGSSAGTIPYYEEGTWTAAEVSKVNLTGTGIYTGGTYTRIGNLVFVRLESITGYSVTTANIQTYIIFSQTGLPGATNSTLYLGTGYSEVGSKSIAVGISDASGANTNIFAGWLPQGTGAFSMQLVFSYKI